MRLFAWMAALTSFVWIPSTHAQVGAENLNFDACIEVDANEVARLLNLEIAARSTRLSERVSSDVRLTGSCPAEGDVVVELVGTDPGGQPIHAERHFVWQRVEPEARARLLAIGIAEMLPEPPVAPDATPVAKAVVVSAAPVIKPTATQSTGPVLDASTHWLRMGAGSAFFSTGAPGLILNVQVAKRIGQRIGVGVIGEGIYSATETSVGATAVGDTVFRSLAVGPTAYLESRTRLVHARAQLGLTGGVASLSGQPNQSDKVEGRTVYGFWGGPQTEFTSGFTVGRHWDVDLWLHAAYNLTSIRGRVVELTTETRGGLWYAAGMGIGRGF
jgi:hypothetical protein